MYLFIINCKTKMILNVTKHGSRAFSAMRMCVSCKHCWFLNNKYLFLLKTIYFNLVYPNLLVLNYTAISYYPGSHLQPTGTFYVFYFKINHNWSTFCNFNVEGFFRNTQQRWSCVPDYLDAWAQDFIPIVVWLTAIFLLSLWHTQW